MTFNDIFKSSFLEEVQTFSLPDLLLAMLISFLVGLYIFLIYKKTFKGVMVSTGFSYALIALPMITALVILAVTSNVILSLGMVGALSIVRFRSAIKEPMEIVFLFWSIAAGIVIGADLLMIGIVGSIIIGIVILIISAKKPSGMPYILVLECNDEQAEAVAMNIVKKNVKKYMVKSKTIRRNGIELSLEVRLHDASTDFANALCRIPGVESAVLVTYNGEYLS